MGRLLVVCSLLTLVLGGCASSLGEAGVVPTADVSKTARSGWASGERPLTSVIEAPARPAPPAWPASPYRLVSDEFSGDRGFYDAPPPPPPAEPATPDEPAAPAEPPVVELQPVPDTMPEPREVIEAPCPTAGPRLSRGCDPCAPVIDPCCWNPCEKGYVGFAPSIFPGLGAGIEFGVHFSRSDRALWSFEMGMQYQDLWKEFNNEKGDGQLAMARIGVRVRFNPGACGHWTLRFGGTWFEAEGTPVDLDFAQIDYRGDYLGAYVGIGYEWDLGKRWSTGPEVGLVVANLINKRPDRLNTGVPDSDREEVAIVPMFFWHINYRL